MLPLFAELEEINLLRITGLSDLSMLAEVVALKTLTLDWMRNMTSLPSRLAQATAQIDMTRWPAPVIRLYLGLLTPAAVLAAAKGDQVCEANFYTGELDLLNGAKADATPLFRAAAAGCAKNVAAYAAGLAELKVLGLKP